MRRRSFVAICCGATIIGGALAVSHPVAAQDASGSTATQGEATAQPIMMSPGMRIYAHHGIEDFIVCAGYKGYLIKEYFANLALHRSDVRFDLGRNSIEYLGQNEPLNWRVTVVDTGENTMPACSSPTAPSSSRSAWCP